MTPYETYQKARSQRLEGERWAELIGKKSHATAPHNGEIVAAQGKFTIHFQPSDGATNYHEAPKCLCAELEDAMRANAAMLIAESIRSLRKKESDALIGCKKFASDIIEEISALEEAEVVHAA